MEIGTLNALNEGMYPSLPTLMEAIALITGIFAIAGFAICLAGIAWLCFEETQQPARRQMKPTPEPPEPDEYDLLAVLTALDGDLSDNLAGGVTRPAPGVTQASASRKPEKALACGYGHGGIRRTSRTMQAIVCAVIVALCAASFTLKVNGGGEVKPRETAGNTQQKPASKTAGGAVGTAERITAEQLPDCTRITTGHPTRPTRLITGRWRRSRAPSLSQPGHWPTRQSAR